MPSLANIAPTLRAAGLTVVELPGWRTRTRPGSHAPKGFLAHHTAGSSDSLSYVEWMTYVGRPSEGIPGPLCQIALSRTGIVYLCAAGRANHAGKTRAIGNWLQAGDGNTQLIGCEALHRGGTEPWTPTHYNAYVKLAATVNKFMGWPASHTLGHKETSLTGKVDPTFNMNTFRANVASAMAGSFEEEDMATPAELWTQYRIGGGEADGQTPITTLAQASIYSNHARLALITQAGQITKLLADTAAIKAAVAGVDVDEAALAAQLVPLLVEPIVTELGDAVGLTEEEVEAAIRRVLGSLDNAPAPS